MDKNLFNAIEPYEQGFLKVSEIHSIYYELLGNPNGIPIVFLHGGPGGQISQKIRRLFDPNLYHIILFDQRGAGKSIPFAEIKDNTTFDLIEDLEKIRIKLNIEKWILFGGSWGTTLALCYAIAHPERVLALLLRGVFLARQEDVNFLYEKGASDFYPEAFERYKSYIESKQITGKSILEKYYLYFTNPQNSQEEIQKAAYEFNLWESNLVSNLDFDLSKHLVFEPGDLQIAKLESHYFINKSFLPSDNYILENISKIKNIKTIIVHGRQDVDTRPIGAYLLNQALNNSELFFIEQAGHTMWEEKLLNKLVELLKEPQKVFDL
ncbi:prolyl aminopeptidase [Mycoplasmopsis glycophila]|uniref:Proline iminopeptidase n=1 Tax=Mycoplasmopsis glycophila TaxID=171285 RepID=A0A449AUT0_9BACT|nr:prolyl aminopeptidase [Mycoplasmopsis glycophila]VEU70248.1 Proline iminopeptidase [Mycoplasmopsis glycophila]